MSRIVSFAGLLGVFIVAYACQRWNNALVGSMARDFGIARYLWLHGVVTLIFAAAIVLLSWYVLRIADRSVLVAVGFAVVGLAVMFEYAFQLSVPALLPPRFLDDFLGPNSAYPHFAAALVTVIGIASLFVRKTRPAEATPSPVDG